MYEHHASFTPGSNGSGSPCPNLTDLFHTQNNGFNSISTFKLKLILLNFGSNFVSIIQSGKAKAVLTTIQEAYIGRQQCGMITPVKLIC